MTVLERTPAEWTPIRRAVAKRMAAANRDVPQFHVTCRIGVDTARVRADFATRVSGAKVTLTAVLVHAVAAALRENPRLNAIWEGDELYLASDVNVGVAVSLDGGLVAPALLHVDRLDLLSVAEQLRDLVGRARDGGLRPAELTDGTFTLSNLGMFDVTAFAAIVTPPQVAILATGSTFTAPVLVGDQWEAADFLDATVSCDHRAVDGAEAARFLQILKRELEAPLSDTTEVTR